jgi:RNA polymerase sigma-70 factor (ECF subfamily)
MKTPVSDIAEQRFLLACAQAGDERAFRRLVEPYRRALEVHCYRMLGSAQDAEDMAQETLLRAWRALERFEPRVQFQTWLYRIATNACLDELERRPRRPEPVDPFPDRPWDETASPTYEPASRYAIREGMELALMRAIQELPGRQRAVLIFRDVLGWTASEVAEVLGSTVASVNSALQRARATMAKINGEAERTESLSDADREMLERYVAAFERYDLTALTSLIREDAKQSMPPFDMWLNGRDDMMTWWFGPGIGCKGSRMLRPASANGMPTFGQYKPSPDGGYDPWALQVLDVSDGRIREITFFLDTAKLFPLFGLPLHLDA